MHPFTFFPDPLQSLVLRSSFIFFLPSFLSVLPSPRIIVHTRLFFPCSYSLFHVLPRLRYFIIGTIRPLSWIIPQADKVAEYRRVSLYGSSVSSSVPLFQPSFLPPRRRITSFFLLLLGVFRERESGFSSLVIVPRSIIIPASGWEGGDYLIKVDTKLQILSVDEYSH